MPQIRFDPSINLGHLFTFTGFLVAGVGAYYGTRAELSIVDQRLRAVEAQIAKLTDVVLADARQEVRIAGVEKRLDRIEAGWPIRGRSEAGVVP